MAVEQLTTRRALIVAGAALPALAATLVHAKPTETEGKRQRRVEREFVEDMSSRHPQGRETACRSLRAGFFPDDCVSSQLTKDGRFILHFYIEKEGHPPRFGWADARDAFIHGPVA